MITLTVLGIVAYILLGAFIINKLDDKYSLYEFDFPITVALLWGWSFIPFLILMDLGVLK